MRRIMNIVSRPLAAFNIHPNLISVAGIVFAIPYVWFVLHHELAYALIFAALAAGMDLFDGSVARLSGKRSNFGNYFETMADKIVDFMLIGVWAIIYPVAGVLALCGSFLASYAKPRVALVIITDNRDWPGIGERPDKMALLLLGIFISIFVPQFRSMPFMEAVLYLIAIVCFVGAMQRIIYAKNLIEEAERKGTILPYLKK